MQAGPEGQSETERNKAVVRQFIEEVQNEKNKDVFDELNAEHPINTGGASAAVVSPT